MLSEETRRKLREMNFGELVEALNIQEKQPEYMALLVGLSIALILFALGEKLSTALLIGAPVSAVFAILCVTLYRFRSGASKSSTPTLPQTAGRVCIWTLPRLSPMRTISSGSADIFYLSKTELWSGLTALPIL